MAQEQKRKLEINWNETETNKDSISRLPRKEYPEHTVAIFKNHSEIILAENLLIIFPSTDTINYTFEKLPEWSIPYFKLGYSFSTEDGYIVDDANSTIFDFYESWAQSGEDYIYSITIKNVVLRIDSLFLPLFFNAKLKFINPRIFNELQFNKK